MKNEVILSQSEIKLLLIAVGYYQIEIEKTPSSDEEEDATTIRKLNALTKKLEAKRAKQ